jgi:hypothetical protein
MKRFLLLIPFLFTACSFTNATKKVKNFTKCYVKQIPAPFWVCYQSSFVSVGKIHADKISRLKQEEAYSIGVSDLVFKLQSKTKIFLRKLGIEDQKLISDIKDFVILSVLQGDSWFSDKEKMIYVQVKINEKDFKDFLYEKLRNKVKKENFERAFDETF